MQTYFNKIGLPHMEQPREEENNIVQEVMLLTPPTSFTQEEILKLWSYRIPEISEDGSCSLVEQLQPEPFHLAQHLYGDNSPTYSASVIQWRMNHVVQQLSDLLQTEWIGVYARFPHQAGLDDGLVKLAYRGEPSRPVFPINEEFLTKSSNSLTAHHNKAHMIDDTRSRSHNTVYYECSGKVRSECCLPIIDPVTQRNLGIIDVESWKPSHANSAQVVWQVGRVCCELAQTGLINAHCLRNM